MRIVILGSTGFLGTALTKKLKKYNLFKIYELSKSKNIDLANLNKTKKFILKIKPQVIINCAGYAYSVHYVAKNPSHILKNDLQIHLNIYKIAEKLKVKPKIINLLCNCSYPGSKKIQNENHWDYDKVHKSVYVPGNIHRIRQIISKASFEQFGIKSINLLIGGMFGPGDHLEELRLHALDGIIYRMTLAKKKKIREFKIYGTGKPIREWIYVNDVVNAIKIAIGINDPIIDPINITNNFSLSINSIAKKVKKILNYKGKLINDLSYKDGDLIKKMDKKSSRFVKYFNNLKFSDFNNAISKTVKYYEKVL
jgi:GDP-L-fucose synthase